jgi:hypothetical protein
MLVCDCGMALAVIRWGPITSTPLRRIGCGPPQPSHRTSPYNAVRSPGAGVWLGEDRGRFSAPGDRERCRFTNDASRVGG